MTTTPPELLEFRRQIDAIDDEIIALIKRRTEITHQVGQLKAATSPGRCPLRAGREAIMIRRVVKSFEGSYFSPDAAAQIWRLFIGASLSVEAKMTLSIADREGDVTCYWLAREYFGRFIPMLRHGQPIKVVADLASGDANVGIIPDLMPGDHWWLALLGQTNPPQIFTTIPFVKPASIKNLPSAFGIGHIDPEPTGDDTTLLVLELSSDVSQSRVQQGLLSAGLTASLIDSVTDSAGRRFHLLSLEGFFDKNSPQLATLSQFFGDNWKQSFILGAYANTVIIESA